MLQALRPGDEVLVLRWVKVHKRQIVVAKIGRHFIIKRVQGVRNGIVRLGADNPQVDPKEWLVPRGDIVGVVIFVQKFDEGD